MKTCSKCNEAKSIDSFYAAKTGDGKYSSCKQCCVKASKAWQLANPEKHRTAKAQWSKAHPEAMKAYTAKWLKANPDARAKWKREHPDAVAALYHKRRSQQLAYEGQHYTAADVKELLADQHGLCAYCGQTMNRYQVDHIQPLSTGGGNGPDNICLACPACNMSKGSKNLLMWAMTGCGSGQVRCGI